jgi:hypothetical protein
VTAAIQAKVRRSAAGWTSTFVVSGVDSSDYSENGTNPFISLLWSQLAGGASFDVAHDYSWGTGAVMLATASGVAVGALTNALFSYAPLNDAQRALAYTVFKDTLPYDSRKGPGHKSPANGAFVGVYTGRGSLCRDVRSSLNTE